jgi:hypothetical protein
MEGPFLEAFGCVYGHKPYFLGRLPENPYGPGTGDGVRHISVNGSLVAYEVSEFGKTDWARWLVIVHDLRTGRVLHEVPTGTPLTPNPDPMSVGLGPAVAIVVKGDGAVAWIVRDREETKGGPGYYQVHAVDKTGSRVLAAGTDIDPSSLALAGSTLYWTQGGQPASASLN